MTKPDQNIEPLDIFQEFAKERNADDSIDFQFDYVRRRIVKQNEDDLFDIEQYQEKNTTSVSLTVDDNDEEEVKLSTRLNRLSTPTRDSEEKDELKQRTTTTAAATSVKKQSSMVSTSTNQPIPKYLLSTSKEFNQMILTLRRQTNTSISTEELRDMAILLYELERIELDKLLWITYLHSGQGTLVENREPSLFVWSIEMKLKMIAESYTKVKHPKEIIHDECIKYVTKMLDKCRSQTNDYENQLKEKKQKLGIRWTTKIQETLMKFVQEYDIALYRISIQADIIRIKYDFFDRFCQFEFSNASPNLYQTQMFEYLTQKKFDKEKSTRELAILKQRHILNYLPKAFRTLEISLPKSMVTITGTNLCQHLKDRSEKVLKQTKSDLMMIYMAAAEARANQCQQEYDNAMAKLKEIERIGPVYRQFTKTMSDIMLKRFNNISEHLTSAYRLKLRTFTKPSTDKIR